ncbi:hypothetical protein CES85_3121 (plasmid) [Ochrobactrum quorumnocens]|uniref:Uncharacterized protein n=1 Tax=Ochrobactrum quorumnocens TaxID=271865 RepID=A0A248UMA4_9HYPH|nr:hypothetical protein CES85_3121 [[Ochrobactrum] quorumnocens]
MPVGSVDRAISARTQGSFGLEDGFASSQGLIDHGVETPRIFSNSPSYLIPIMFRNQTASY